ncbi:hypothetical protein FYZ48_26230 [Gimesia chilikensis]|uniref:hypothetical protein n=1 Tax=Gimesia chilikensis TaxID=2605989 RepID=UPI0011ED2F29|nr:hypothetical protein [Gimesia chilikensis]KAA0131636.1 hypothetical protein FYZ48_26230 [Gimesia chilikensis]
MRDHVMFRFLLCICTVLGSICFIPAERTGLSFFSDRVHAANPVRHDPKTRQAIERGMKWLTSAIHRDGTVGADQYHLPDLGCTSMVGLVLLAEGSTPREGQYQKQSRAVLYGVLDLVESRPLNRSPQEVTLIQRKIGMNADVFLATLYLSQVYYDAPGEEKAIRVALDRLVEHICLTQGKDGTWGNESWAPILGTILGWESLRAASSAGLKIEASEQLVGQALIKKLQSQPDVKQNWMHQFYKEAAAVRVLYSMGYRDQPEFQECVDQILKTVKTEHRIFRFAGGEEYLAFYFITECMLKGEDRSWKAWYPQVRDGFLRTQNRDGSWKGHHCITDRTFCTAGVLLTLLSPNFSLPMSDL